MALVGWVRHLWQTRLRATPRAQDRTDAALTAVLGVVLLGAGVSGLWGPEPDRVAALGRWAHLAPLALGCALMLRRRTNPVLALVGGAAAFAVDVWLGGSIGMVFVLFDLIYSAALHAGRVAVGRLGVLVAAAPAVAFVQGWLVWGELRWALLMAVQVFAFVSTPLAWGTAVRRQSELTALAQARAEDLRRLAEHRGAQAVADARAQMARDLHDAIAGNVSAMAIRAEAALAEPPGVPGAADRDRAALAAIRTTGLRSLAELRTLIGFLRSDADDVAAPPRLREAGTLLAGVRAAGVDVDWHGPPPDELDALPTGPDQAAYRILQEALTNAVKHGAGPTVAVRVDVGAAALVLSLSNPVADGAPSGPRGLGLVTMRERAEALGGRFSAGPREGTWVVDVALPLEAA